MRFISPNFRLILILITTYLHNTLSNNFNISPLDFKFYFNILFRGSFYKFLLKFTNFNKCIINDRYIPGIIEAIHI